MVVKDFYKELEKNPADWELRGVFADWLYDNNDPLEKAQRYMIEHKKHPVKIFVTPYKEWFWIVGKVHNPCKADYHPCILPENLFSLLQGEKHSHPYFKYYFSLENAERNLSSHLY